VSEAGVVTAWLKRWRAGDDTALHQLLPLVYAELKRLAALELGRESGPVTLQPTVLVHEAYFKIIAADRVDWRDRAHFLALAARAMRQVLIEHARARRAAKRDGGERITLSSADVPDTRHGVGLLALEQALRRLEALDPRKAKVIELRVYGGLEFSEIGALLGVSRATLDRDFRSARAWLYHTLGEPGDS
jgi:RNA polymerase sigma factor (TIGR02999 family)